MGNSLDIERFKEAPDTNAPVNLLRIFLGFNTFEFTAEVCAKLLWT